jgi:hypothetical protein
MRSSWSPFVALAFGFAFMSVRQHTAVLRDFDVSILHLWINGHARKLQIADRLVAVCARSRPVTNFLSRI